MNFINLTTARSVNRSTEVGLRKVIGARRQQITWQFLGESWVIIGIAMLVTWIFVIFLFPFFQNLTRIPFVFSDELKNSKLRLIFIEAQKEVIKKLETKRVLVDKIMSQTENPLRYLELRAVSDCLRLIVNKEMK